MNTHIRWDLARCGSVTELTGGGTERTPLAQAIATIRAELDAARIGDGDRVVLPGARTARFFARLLASWSAGCCVVCVNDRLTPFEWRNVVRFVAPAAAFAHPAARDAGVRLLDCGAGAAVAADCPPIAEITAAADADALVLFTSGTTAAPKGVVHSFGSLAARIAHNGEHIPQSTLARSLCLLPTHFGHGLIGNSLTPLLHGGELVLADGSDMATLARLGDIIDAHGIRFVSSVPSMWQAVLRLASPPRGGSLQRIHIGSAPVSATLMHEVATWSGTREVFNLYGLTETANWVAGHSLADGTPKDGLVGRMWGGEAAVLTAAGEIARAGDGEILLRPPSLMRGYLDRPELSAAALHDGWLLSGDTGSIDGDGRIRLRGRRRFEINRAGVKISPEEVELLLERHPAIAAACAFAVPDIVAGEVVAAAITLDANSATTRDALDAWCRERIRPECVPTRWFFRADLPRSDRGKLDRNAIREACLRAGT